MTDKWFQSSTGTGDLALTIKGFLIALVPFIIIAAKYYGFAELQEIDVINWIEGITAGIAAVIVFIGVVRKIANRFE
jgi:hypothetical protein